MQALTLRDCRSLHLDTARSSIDLQVPVAEVVLGADQDDTAVSLLDDVQPHKQVLLLACLAPALLAALGCAAC